ncbi:hypothetical protein C8Q78DRAFT_995083 [Trametes maxima]|nr:hypothetical protein C8Q78DRAFT_995083 [Trametes maxima]
MAGNETMLWPSGDVQTACIPPPTADFHGRAYAEEPSSEQEYGLGWEATAVDYYQNAGLFVDTTAAMPYPNYVLDEVDAGGLYVDSPQSSPFSDTHFVSSIHPVPLPPPSGSRSYTLEGAITPITPTPHAGLPAPNPHAAQRSPSPPPMAALLPPSPNVSRGPIPLPKPEPSPPPSTTIVPSRPVAQRRSRGRPRKNPSPTRAVSPPPVVDYPFPSFPDSPSTLPAVCTDDVAMPPMSYPVSTLTAGTAGATGSMSAPSGSAVPGQSMFRLTARREGESEGSGGQPSEKKKEKKEPVMACLFCRERKIACGPPAPGGPRRCNQCTRRDLVCEYPKESRRGQHKRETRAHRIEALAAGLAAPSAIKPKGKAKANAHLGPQHGRGRGHGGDAGDPAAAGLGASSGGAGADNPVRSRCSVPPLVSSPSGSPAGLGAERSSRTPGADGDRSEGGSGKKRERSPEDVLGRDARDSRRQAAGLQQQQQKRRAVGRGDGMPATVVFATGAGV